MTTKLAKIDWLRLKGNRSIVIDRTDDTSHFVSGSVLESASGRQFTLVDLGDSYSVVPVTEKVSSDNAYILVGSLSPEFNQQMVGMAGIEKLSLCRSLGIC